MHDARPGKRISADEQRESFPSHTLPAGAATKPLLPDSFHFVPEAPECSTVPRDAEIAVVTTHLGDESLVLLAYRAMAVPTTPFGDAMKRASKPAA